MKWIGKDKVGHSYVGKEAVQAIYYGATLIWQALRSCFGKGYWRNNMPWINKESWRNN